MKKICLAVVSIFCAFSVQSQTNLTKWVNPFIGTGGHGHTFPGATLPFGMVQLSPDTRIDNSWDGCGGYHYSDSIIYGFSHTHLSGTGVSDYGDIMLMPIAGKGSFENKEYASGFSHDKESAAPGFYEVELRNRIKVSLTATTRVGFHKYEFPEENGSVILDLTHRDQLTEGKITIINSTTVAVKRISNAWARNQHACACIVFSKPFDYKFNAEKTKIIFDFKLLKGEALLTKVGYSLTSEKGAELNLNTELPGWDFAQTKKDATAAWNKELSKIMVDDNNSEKLTIFYTALYHTMLQPNTAMDVDGSYRGMDNQIHQAIGFTYYSVFSLWDTFRAEHPLFSIIDQKRTRDFISTFLKMYEEGGRLPVWELASNETDCMIGYHSASVITDAYVKGIRDFDAELAFEAMKKSANWNHLGLPQYIEQGYLSVDDESESVSKTLEYAYDDWCIANMASLLNKKQDYENFIIRSNAWRNLVDPETRLMRPRKNGGWLSPFDPREVNNHFTEGNSWQYSFFVPQDIQGLIQSAGGKLAFEKLLDGLFSAPSETTGREQADITGLIGQYAHGNEPSHHITYLYNYVDKPEKTRKLVHQILSSFYTTKPDGLIGNEDCGQMSAWYIMSALGLYAVTPGSGEYATTEPYLQSYKVNLENGGSFTDKMIRTENKTKPFIYQEKLMTGKASEYPESTKENINYVTAPIITATSLAFKDSLLVGISSLQADSILYFIANEKGGRKQQTKGDAAFYIYDNCSITAKAYKLGRESKTTVARYFKNPHPDWTINIASHYSSQYSAGGPNGIIDGIKGTENWRKGEWQGYQGQDFECVIDMKSIRNISQFSGSFLQDTRAWILMPSKVEFFTSTDGKKFEPVASVQNSLDPKDYNVQIRSFSEKINSPIQARYVKVKAKNFGKLPEWHLGAGYDAYIFVDELEIQ